jgi:hypothetical protein
VVAVSLTGQISFWGKSPQFQLNREGLVGPRGGLRVFETRKISYFCWYLTFAPAYCRVCSRVWSALCEIFIGAKNVLVKIRTKNCSAKSKTEKSRAVYSQFIFPRILLF